MRTVSSSGAKPPLSLKPSDGPGQTYLQVNQVHSHRPWPSIKYSVKAQPRQEVSKDVSQVNKYQSTSDAVRMSVRTIKCFECRANARGMQALCYDSKQIKSV